MYARHTCARCAHLVSFPAYLTKFVVSTLAYSTLHNDFKVNLKKMLGADMAPRELRMARGPQVAQKRSPRSESAGPEPESPANSGVFEPSQSMSLKDAVVGVDPKRPSKGAQKS